MQVHRGDARELLDGSGLHVDELHPAVGHHDQGAEHRAPGDEQLVVALGVAPAAGVAAHPPPAPRRAERDDDETDRKEPAGQEVREQRQDDHDGGARGGPRRRRSTCRTSASRGDTRCQADPGGAKSSST